MSPTMRTILKLVVTIFGVTAFAHVHAQTEFEPPSGKGRVVVAVSGADGAGRYQVVAQKVARFGYDVFLIDGPAMMGDDGQKLRAAIETAQKSPHALPGKVAMLGFSLGGAQSLFFASGWPDLVAVVVAMYPLTRVITNMNGYVARFKVPVLVLAGENDTFRDCCRIETARAMAAAAAARNLPFELVTYPNAEHQFNLAGRNYNASADVNAWEQIVAKLGQYLGN